MEAIGLDSSSSHPSTGPASLALATPETIYWILMMRLGGVEAGGTKFVCAVSEGPEIILRVSFPTTTPEETIARAIDFFRGHQVAAIGIASFGPIDLDRTSPTYGYITATPKDGWRNTDIAGPLAKAFGVPIGFDTDVNGAALGESVWGAGQGLTDVLYLTVGTGIGGGALSGGKPVHGAIHPEMGHVRVPRDPADSFPGCCPFHHDCLEGLASGTAMFQRWGTRAQDLAGDHPAWRMEARYLALGILNFVMTLSPQRVIVGGGVMHRTLLYDLVREEFHRLVNGYLQSPHIANLDAYIIAPGLGDNAGVLGAIALAQSALALQ